jgi:flagellar biogenesis protein FliO
MLQQLALLTEHSARPAHEGPDWNRYVLVCAALLLVLGGLAWGLRALVAGSTRAGAARRSLQVIDVLSLGGKQRVCVVRCYDRTFALGVGDKEVGLIAEIDAAVSLPKESAPTARAAFGSVLARLTGRTPPNTENLA